MPPTKGQLAGASLQKILENCSALSHVWRVESIENRHQIADKQYSYYREENLHSNKVE